MRRTSLIRFAVFAAAVVTVSPAPVHVGLGNYVFDPESIPQNEKILKLFIRLAAHAANRLIHLKIKSHLDPDEFDEVLEYFKDPSSTPSGRQMIGGFMEDVIEKTMRPDFLEKPPSRNEEDLQNAIDGVLQAETDPANVPVSSNGVSESPVPGEESQVEVENRGLFNTAKNDHATPFAEQSTNPNKASTQTNESEVAQQQSVSKRETIDELLSFLDQFKKKLIDNFGKDAWDEAHRELCDRIRVADRPGDADVQNSVTPASSSGSEAPGGVERVSESFLNAGTHPGINTLQHGSQASDIGLKQSQGALEHVQRMMSNTAGKIGQTGSKSMSTGFGLF